MKKKNVGDPLSIAASDWNKLVELANRVKVGGDEVVYESGGNALYLWAKNESTEDIDISNFVYIWRPYTGVTFHTLDDRLKDFSLNRVVSIWPLSWSAMMPEDVVDTVGLPVPPPSEPFPSYVMNGIALEPIPAQSYGRVAIKGVAVGLAQCDDSSLIARNHGQAITIDPISDRAIITRDGPHRVLCLDLADSGPPEIYRCLVDLNCEPNWRMNNRYVTKTQVGIVSLANQDMGRGIKNFHSQITIDDDTSKAAVRYELNALKFFDEFLSAPRKGTFDLVEMKTKAFHLRNEYDDILRYASFYVENEFNSQPIRGIGLRVQDDSFDRYHFLFVRSNNPPTIPPLVDFAGTERNAIFATNGKIQARQNFVCGNGTSAKEGVTGTDGIGNKFAGGICWEIGTGGGGGVSEGDKGDITVSSGGTVWTIDNDTITTPKIAANAVTYSKIQNVTGERLLGNPNPITGACTEIPLGAGLAFMGGALVATGGPPPPPPPPVPPQNLTQRWINFSTNGNGPPPTIQSTNGCNLQFLGPLTYRVTYPATQGPPAVFITPTFLARANITIIGLTFVEFNILLNMPGDQPAVSVLILGF
jgi:hypothetical protein